MNKLALDIGSQLFGGTTAHPLADIKGVGSLVSLFLNIAFMVAGLVLLIFIIIGGIGLIGSAGDGNPENMEKAKKTLTSAVLGFVIVFASYWIVKLIAQLLGLQNII